MILRPCRQVRGAIVNASAGVGFTRVHEAAWGGEERMNGFNEIGSFGLVLGHTYSFLWQGSDQFRRAKTIETLRGIVGFEFEDGTTLKIFHHQSPEQLPITEDEA